MVSRYLDTCFLGVIGLVWIGIARHDLYERYAGLGNVALIQICKICLRRHLDLDINETTKNTESGFKCLQCCFIFHSDFDVAEYLVSTALVSDTRDGLGQNAPRVW